MAKHESKDLSAIDAAANRLYAEWRKAGEAYLAEKRVVLINEFEQYLSGLQELPDWAFEHLEGKSRCRWENLVDWVKASLTKEGFIDYFDIGTDRAIVYLPWCGQIGKQQLTWDAEAWKTIRAIMQLME